MKLNAGEINKKLEELKGWEFENNSIVKTFEFQNFLESIDFVNNVAPIAEGINHHPDITINYNKVTLALSTHSEGGLTDKDFSLAEKIDNLP